MSRIVELDTTDIRFRTSLSLDGSDAMNQNIANLLLAANFDVPVCLHAGRVACARLFSLAAIGAGFCIDHVTVLQFNHTWPIEHLGTVLSLSVDAAVRFPLEP